MLLLLPVSLLFVALPDESHIHILGVPEGIAERHAVDKATKGCNEREAFKQHFWKRCDHECLLNGSPRMLSGHPRPRVVFSHVVKTGGTAVECAAQQFDVEKNIWCNVGHLPGKPLPELLDDCANNGTRAVHAITMRDPYAWWRSVFVYGKECVHASPCFRKRYTFEELVAASYARHQANQKARSARSRAERGHEEGSSIGPFSYEKGWLDRFGMYQEQSESQCAWIHRACGQPCHAGYFLRTETLVKDAKRMSRELKLPAPGLKLDDVNPTAVKGEARNPNMTRTVFTKHVLAMINEMENCMFSTYGYDKRLEEFEL